MSILGILFGQKKTVIGVKDDQGSIGVLKGLLKQTIGGIGGIVIDATISEQHTTTCEVTENPVEDGAKITDHVQMNPAQLMIEGVISDTPLGFALIGNVQNLVHSVGEGLSKLGVISGNFGGFSGPLSIQAYNKLVDLQKSRQPFTVVTGLKRYKNMILTELSVPRTVDTSNAIHFRATMKEIIIVKSQTALTSLAHSVKKLASKTKDLGHKVTDAVNAGSKISSESTSTTSNGSVAFDIFHPSGVTK